MAKCPHCGYKLKIWDVKAECPACKVNIPNYDWINRLEQDSIAAEAAYAKMRRKVVLLKYAMAGTKLRIARLPLSFAPLFSFLLPLFGVSFYLPYFEGFNSYNIITLTAQVLGFDFGAIPGFIASPVLGGAMLRLLGALALVYISLLSLPLVSLVFLLTNYRNLNSKGLFVTNLIAAICMFGSVFLFESFSALQQASTVNAFSAKVGWGLYVSAGLFLASSIINYFVAKSPVDQDALNKKFEKADAAKKF